MKVAVTGANGQVGRGLMQTVPSGIDLEAWTRTDLDICDEIRVKDQIEAYRPDLIVNTAAFTDVDRAESHRRAAEQVNSKAVNYLAQAAADIGSRLIHLSTDYVFDGTQSRPYRPKDAASPLSVYGKTKRAGELGALERLKERAVVLRSAWIYAAGSTNFVTKILSAAIDRKVLRVVCDQIGTPTWANSLANTIWKIALHPEVHGIHHWTDAGVASRYDFAVAIIEEATKMGLVPTRIDVEPVYTDCYPTSATRPAFSVLDLRDTCHALNLQPSHWRAQLRRMLEELTNA